MSDLRIASSGGSNSRLLSDRWRRLHAGKLAEIGGQTWQRILGAVVGVARRIERANVASDRRRLIMLCQQRHRRWD